MPADADRASTGDTTLDAMLEGGLPRSRAVLLSGGQGTGKTTLGMQFLQAALQDDERCLFFSTDQTPSELRESFSSYEWSITADGLDVVSVTAQAGTVNGDQALALQTIDGNQPFDAFSAAAASEFITRYVNQFAPVDRVVLDSLSALSTYQSNASPQTIVVDLLRMFTQEFNATTIFTAEGPAAIDPVQYLANGTIQLQRETIDGDDHITARVLNLRGVDYDRRAIELHFDTDGVSAVPATRSMPEHLQQHGHAATGVNGLDALMGGGLVTGTGSLLRHDGRATIGPLLTTIFAALHEQGYAITLLPTMDLRPARLEGMLAGHGLDMQDLLDSGELYIVDFVGAWNPAESNVYGATDDRSQLEGVLREVDELTQGKRATIASADVLAHEFSADDVRTLRYYQEGKLLSDTDVLLHVQNPTLISDTMSQFFLDTADQVAHTWLTEDGRQYISLDASSSGYVGTTSLVEHVAELPYVTVQDPPQHGN